MKNPETTNPMTICPMSDTACVVVGLGLRWFSGRTTDATDDGDDGGGYTCFLPLGS